MWELWIADEDQHFAADHTREHAELVVSRTHLIVKPLAHRAFDTPTTDFLQLTRSWW